MQKIVLFIEPQEDKSYTPLKIGNLFMNRFAIHEDGCHEILKIYYLDNTINEYGSRQLTEQEGPDRIKKYEILFFALIPFRFIFFLNYIF